MGGCVGTNNRWRLGLIRPTMAAVFFRPLHRTVRGSQGIGSILPRRSVGAMEFKPHGPRRHDGDQVVVPCGANCDADPVPVLQPHRLTRSQEDLGGGARWRHFLTFHHPFLGFRISQ